MKCKVLFVHRYSDNIAGQELSLLSRVRGLVKMGVECMVMLPSGGRFAELLRENGIRVTVSPLSRLSKTNPFPFIKTVLSIWKTLRKEKIDIIHCSGVYPAQYSVIAAKMRGIPCVVHVNGTVYDEYDYRSSLIKYADRVIGVSKACAEGVIEKSGISKDKVVYLYNGIIEEEVHVDSRTVKDLRAEYGIRDDEKLIGQVGQIMPRKGVECFIRMAKKVSEKFPEARFFLVGDYQPKDEKYYNEMKELADKSGIGEKIIFTGFQKDVYKYIAAFDVSVLCSKDEGLGRVIVESMNMGVPVVVSDIPGISEVVEDSVTGLRCKADEPERFADAVCRILKDKSFLNALVQTAKKEVLNRFVFEKHAEAVVDVYSDLRRHSIL